VSPILVSRRKKRITLSQKKETKMIKPLNAPQLSAVKPRCGLQSISDLLPRLIRQYELQAELMNRGNLATGFPALPPAIPQVDAPVEQATFAWYE
jgi:hypothetical protein